MQIVLCSDLHASETALKKFEDFVLTFYPNGEKPVIIFAGDWLNMGEPVEYSYKFIQLMGNLKADLFWVPGNNDFGRGYHILYDTHPSIEGRVQILDKMKILGVGGSPASWSGQAYDGKSGIKKEDLTNSIFVSHVPPPVVFNYVKTEEDLSPAVEKIKAKTQNQKENQKANDQDLKVLASGSGSLGAPSVSRLTHSPLVHICGHYHEQWGLAMLGRTKIIKLGALALGHCAIMDSETLSVAFYKI